MGQLISKDTRDRSLHIAIKNNYKWHFVRMLLLCGYDVNDTDYYGRTPLHIAVSHKCSLEVIRLLVSKSRNINEVDNNGNTALHTAIKENASFQVIECLLEEDADADIVDDEDNNALLLALCHNSSCMLKLVETLVKRTSDINSKNKFEESALHVALKYEMSTDVVQYLLQSGVDVNLCNQWKASALHSCMLYGKNSPYLTEITELLINEDNIDVNSQDQGGDTPLHLAVRNELPFKVIDILCEQGADCSMKNSMGCIPWHYVQTVPVMERLFVSKEFVNMQDKRKSTPLHHMFKSKAIQPSLLKKALSYGCDPSIQDHLGRTVLHVAIALEKHSSHLFIITKHLMQHFRNINIQDHYGDTVLHLAIRADVSHDVIHLLMNNGADPDLSNKQNFTALQEFHKHKSIDYRKLFLVLPKSTNVNITYPASGASFLHRFISEYCHDSDGCSHTASLNTETLELLLQHGLDPNITTKKQTITKDNIITQTPLFMVLIAHKKERCLTTVSKLLEAGADPNIHVKNQQTAFEVFFEQHKDKFSMLSYMHQRMESIILKESLLYLMKGGFNLNKCPPSFVTDILKHFVKSEDWDTVKKLYRYGVSLQLIQQITSDGNDEMALSLCEHKVEFSPLTLFELAAIVLRVTVKPNSYKGLDLLTFKTDGNLDKHLPETLKKKIRSAAEDNS